MARRNETHLYLKWQKAKWLLELQKDEAEDEDDKDVKSW